MTLSVDIVGKSQIKLRILQGPNFDFDRERIKALPDKAPMYGLNEQGRNVFQYWEVPYKHLGNLLQDFKASELIPKSDHAKKILDRLKGLLVPIESRPKDTKEYEWPVNPPMNSLQEDYIRIDKTLTKLILAADPALGKTYCSLTRAWTYGFKRIIVATPKVTLKNWRKESRKHLDMPSVIYHGTKLQREKILKNLTEDDKIIVTTYAMLAELNGVECDQIIFDEAHVLSHENKIHKTAKKFVEHHDDACVQLLTGTPIQHKPQDLWGLVDIIYPELAGSRKSWEDKYQEYLRSFTKTILVKDKFGNVQFDDRGDPRTRQIEIFLDPVTINLDHLRERIKPYVYRQVRPSGFYNFEETVETITVEMTAKQAKMYKQVTIDAINQIGQGQLNDAASLQVFSKLVQVSEGGFHLNPDVEESGKMEFIKDRIKNRTGPIVIFSRFVEGLRRIVNEFPNEAVLFAGDSKRDMALWSFQGCETREDELDFMKQAKKGWKFAPGEADIICCTISRLASLGVEMHKSSHVILLSFMDNANYNKQAIDRVCRPGQQSDKVLTEILISEDTIEEDLLLASFRNLKHCKHVLDGAGSLSHSDVVRMINKLRAQVG